MNTTDIVARLRDLARLARAQRTNCALGRELDRLAEDVMGVRRSGTTRSQASSTIVVGGRTVLVQRPRGQFAV